MINYILDTRQWDMRYETYEYEIWDMRYEIWDMRFDIWDMRIWDMRYEILNMIYKNMRNNV